MQFEMLGVKSVDPNFEAPKSHNGEPMTLMNAGASGDFVVLRYEGYDAVSSRAIDEVVVDCYVNQHGAQFLQITSRPVELPPPEPTTFQRLRIALKFLIGSRYDRGTCYPEEL